MSRAAARRTALRRRAWRHGRTSEAICRLLLRLKGYRILARGYRAPVGEIDIIARRGGLLLLVEVKARARDKDAAEALQPRQQRRIARAAEHFLQRQPALAGLAQRFDVMLVSPWRLPRHVAGAWLNEGRDF
jgi:putative endonuclease